VRGRGDKDRDRDTDVRAVVRSKILMAASLMLRANQRQQAKRHGTPWPEDRIVDPRLIARPKKAGGTKPGLAEAVEAMHAMIELDDILVRRAAYLVASRIWYHWQVDWIAHAERSDDLEQLAPKTQRRTKARPPLALMNQLRVAYNRAYPSGR
jgi:hypothetical protein